MKIKKKIDVEIQVKSKEECDENCVYLVSDDDIHFTCGLYNVPNDEYYQKVRCPQCIEAFGSGVQND